MLLNRPGEYSRKPVGRVGQFRGMGQLHNQRLQCRSGSGVVWGSKTNSNALAIAIGGDK
jgi:hypothetical protein